MAHFAELDSSNVVVNVVVIADSDTAEKPNTSIDGFRDVRGREVESIGIDLYIKLYRFRIHDNWSAEKVEEPRSGAGAFATA